MIQLQGKFLVRPTKFNGKTVYILCGVSEAIPPIEVSDGDEMWAVKLTIDEVVKFEGAGGHFSPEDFLENINDIQNPKNKNWTRKEKP